MTAFPASGAHTKIESLHVRRRFRHESGRDRPERAPFRDVNINIMTFASKEGQMTDSGPPNGRPSV